MKIHLKLLTERYWFRLGLSLCFAITAALSYANRDFIWMGLSLCLLLFSIWWQLSLYRIHTKRVLFMIDALENNDSAIHFPEEQIMPETREVNRALNRVGRILYNVKSETVQQEKYYELIMDCVNTGVLVLNENGAVYQKNNEALRLLGLNVFTHIRQLNKVDIQLMKKIEFCRPGDKIQTIFNNERGTINLSIRVSGITVREEQLRILAFNDINSELDEKEIDSWIRLTRVLTHEIMNSVTPITSLSETLLSLADTRDEEIRRGLQTISTTGKGLLSFVESYRRFTRIPTPEPSLFYVKAFIDRMVELARHQNKCDNITFHIDIAPADLIVYADENLISQVVINLLKNAIEACEESLSPQIVVEAVQKAGMVIISVIDNGSGIVPEAIDKVFVPFFTTKSKGSGIGLSLCRQIMNRHGGSISLDSQVEKGSSFVLHFPIVTKRIL